MLKRFFFL